ncbi:hypothetical protein M413DRAFT_443328 [Hebeloma cylindrosporum]|uniref:F-box domain-containing protein n=1 Tax=Hebeloma cylindrosporum TaxID=76867 RepID=A0A0C3C618_HEBCY|nr:hypothetical protein M413DRAFT_443328 [Hebeloma cylindrosporum h7]
MHPALAVPEIIQTILEYLLPKPKHYRKAYKEYYLLATASRSSVLNVALTCRSFSEPALDILWWAMDDLTPLFNFLPGFQNDQEIDFPISTHALEVLEKFASRIRFYCIMDTAEDPVNITSYVQVLQTLGRFHLLPRLQFLYAERNEPQLLFFGSPTLRTFRAKRILPKSNADHIQAFLDLLPLTSPKILALYIRFPLRERSLHAVRRFPKLQFLVLDSENVDTRLSLGADFLTNLSCRQTLDKWFLRGSISVAPRPTSDFAKVDFDSLTYLAFTSKKPSTSIAEYIPLLRAAKFPSLERMEVSLAVDNAVGQSRSATKLWRDFFKHLRSATSSLLAIEVMIKGPVASQVSLDDIPDLHTFNRLRSFETNIVHSLSASNLSTMFAHWPDLTVLHISGVEEVTVDFSSLVDIACQAPKLEVLALQINCEIFPSVDDVPILQHDLETLKLSPLHLENHITLARCIDRIFPELAVLEIFDSEQSLRSGVGKEIQEIYEGLQSAKKVQKEREQVAILGRVLSFGALARCNLSTIPETDKVISIRLY